MENDTDTRQPFYGKGHSGSFGPDSPHKRCSARKRRGGGGCQQPAMANGKCRLHGGKSTGIKTWAGKQRQRLAITTHGRRAGPNNPINLARTGSALPGPEWRGFGGALSRGMKKRLAEAMQED